MPAELMPPNWLLLALSVIGLASVIPPASCSADPPSAVVGLPVVTVIVPEPSESLVRMRKVPWSTVVLAVRAELSALTGLAHERWWNVGARRLRQAD